MSNSKPIKVLQFICPTGFYGAERWVLTLGKYLYANTKVECDLVVTKEPENNDLELVQSYKKNAGKTYEIAMAHRFDFSAIRKLCRLIEQGDYDIIHTHGYKSDILGVIAARRSGIQCIVTPHGFENADDIKLRLFIWLGCISMRFAHRVAPLSKQLVDDVKRFVKDDSKICYIQNGVDLTEVEDKLNEATPKRHAHDKEKIIGFVGQMISRKNIVDILDVFDRLYSVNPNVRLRLLGDGDARAELERYANTLPSKKHIEFLGFRDDRLDQLKQFDLFVMTSTLEGIPRCLMEAMAMAIPVAAYDIPGIDQLITHEETGLLAPLFDKDTLFQYWTQLLLDPAKAATLANNARKFVHKNYSAERMAKEYMVLFENQLDKT